MLEPLPTGFDPLAELKNERDYVMQLRGKSSMGNALEWAVEEIERLRAKVDEFQQQIPAPAPELE